MSHIAISSGWPHTCGITSDYPIVHETFEILVRALSGLEGVSWVNRNDEVCTVMFERDVTDSNVKAVADEAYRLLRGDSVSYHIPGMIATQAEWAARVTNPNP